MPYGPDPASDIQRTLYSGLICYRDIIEPYMPVRCLRQLGYVQCIPTPILTPDEVHRPWKGQYTVKYMPKAARDDWVSFPLMRMVVVSQLQPVGYDGGVCDLDYANWYTRHSHPRFYPDRPLWPCPPRSNTIYVRIFNFLNSFYNMHTIFNTCIYIFSLVDG